MRAIQELSMLEQVQLLKEQEKGAQGIMGLELIQTDALRRSV